MLIRYGYHGFHGLTCLFVEECEREKKEEMFRDYVGQTLWLINSIQHLKTTHENQMPQYIELAHPELKPPEMTADEIKQRLLEQLRC